MKNGRNAPRNRVSLDEASQKGKREVEEYIASQPQETRLALADMREIIASAAKGAQERISYGMPSFHSAGPIAYYAVAKAHIGFYPTPSGVAAFEEELNDYLHSKGAIRFPLGEKLPRALIARIVKFRMAELASGAN